MDNFKIYRDNKYDIKENLKLKLDKLANVLDDAQTAFFVEHRIGNIEFDKF